MKNIVVLVSGGGTNLQALIDAQNEGRIINGNISCVISSRPDAYALTRAEQNDIPTVVIPRKEYPDSVTYSKAILKELKNREADLVVLAGFMTILDECLTNEYAYKIINVHPALIPSFCGEGFYGLKVHEKALEYGVKVSGATIHFVNEKADAGAIILQGTVDVLRDDTPEILQRRIMENVEWKLLPEAVSLFCQDRIEIINGKAYIKPEIFRGLKKEKFNLYALEGTMHSDIFNTDISVLIDKGVEIDYATKCAENFNSLSAETLETICKGAKAYCLEFMEMADGDWENELSVMIDSGTEPLELLKCFKPTVFAVKKPKDNRTCYSLECCCDWEIEHGMQIDILDGKVAYMGAFDGRTAWDRNDTDDFNYINKIK